jgi:hypothetical protein
VVVNFAAVIVVGGVHGVIDDVEMAEAVEDVEMGEADEDDQGAGAEVRDGDVEMAEAVEDVEMGEAEEDDQMVGIEEDVEFGAIAD